MFSLTRKVILLYVIAELINLTFIPGEFATALARTIGAIAFVMVVGGMIRFFRGS